MASVHPSSVLPRSQSLRNLKSLGALRDFPGSPVVKTPCFHCRERVLDPWSRNQDPACGVAQPKKNQTKTNEQKLLEDFPGGAVVKKRLPVQGIRVRALVREDPTCCGATKPVRHHYWACALEPGRHNYWARTPQLEPTCLEPVLRNKRSYLNKPAHRG